MRSQPNSATRGVIRRANPLAIRRYAVAILAP
jgi:hypothetical protein